MLVSQPSAVLLLQSLRPAAQLMPHVPLLHDGVPPLLEQAFLQLPQVVALFFRSASQPLPMLLSQLSQFAAHAIPHVPPEQLGVP
jgi:hypothetical protein